MNELFNYQDGVVYEDYQKEFQKYCGKQRKALSTSARRPVKNFYLGPLLVVKNGTLDIENDDYAGPIEYL